MFRQKSLAEICEIIFTANLIHSKILNAEEFVGDAAVRKNLNLGNKLGVLGGDYLLANASTALAKLGNIQVGVVCQELIPDGRDPFEGDKLDCWRPC